MPQTPSFTERNCDHFDFGGDCVFCGRPTPKKTKTVRSGGRPSPDGRSGGRPAAHRKPRNR